MRHVVDLIKDRSALDKICALVEHRYGDMYKRIVTSNDVGFLEDKNPLDNGKFEEIDLAEWGQSSPRYLLSNDFCRGTRNNDYQAQVRDDVIHSVSGGRVGCTSARYSRASRRWHC